MRVASDNSAAAATLAYEAIKKRIIDLTYPPGSKLSEARLVDELGHGRSPIRTAFSRLQGEGWIAVTPQSGTYVRALSEKEIGDIFETRLLLETHVCRAAARNMDGEMLRKLRVSFRRLAPQGGRGLDQDLFDDFNALDSMFHSSIYEAASNALINGLLLNLLEKARWLKQSFPSTPKRMKVAFAELERILEALEERDGERAAKLMREHIGNAADFAADVRKQQAQAQAKARRKQRAA